MNKISNELVTSVQSLTTVAGNDTTTGISGSAVVDMAKYSNAIAKAHIGKLFDNKGALCASTLSIYECISTGLTGSLITASLATSSLISNSVETLLQCEIKASQLSPGFRYIYSHFNADTCSDVAVTIERGKPRFCHDD